MKMKTKTNIGHFFLCVITAVFTIHILVYGHEEQLKQCFVEHLFDFHLDHDSMKTPDEKAEDRQRAETARKQRELELYFYGKKWGIDSPHDHNDDNERGTISGSDSNDCNRDR
jgi:hypothetical protein